MTQLESCSPYFVSVTCLLWTGLLRRIPSPAVTVTPRRSVTPFQARQAQPRQSGYCRLPLLCKQKTPNHGHIVPTAVVTPVHALGYSDVVTSQEGWHASLTIDSIDTRPSSPTARIAIMLPIALCARINYKYVYISKTSPDAPHLCLVGVQHKLRPNLLVELLRCEEPKRNRRLL